MNIPILNLIPKNCETILDVGCGRGTWGFLLRTYKNCNSLSGIDIWKPYLTQLKKLNVYHNLIFSCVPNLPFKNKSFDVVLASEVLEHLPPQKGFIFLSELERIAKKKIILSTPLNLPQGKTVDGNPYNKHLSEWKLKQLKCLGYNAYKVRRLPKTLLLIDKIRRKITRLKDVNFIIAFKEKKG